MTWVIERTGPRPDTGEEAVWYLCFVPLVRRSPTHGAYRWTLELTAGTLARFDSETDAQLALDNLQGYHDGLTTDLEGALAREVA